MKNEEVDSFSPKMHLIFHVNGRISIIAPYKITLVLVFTQNNTTDLHLYLITFIQTFVFLRWIQLLYNCTQNLAIACFHKTLILLASIVDKLSKKINMHILILMDSTALILPQNNNKNIYRLFSILRSILFPPNRC